LWQLPPEIEAAIRKAIFGYLMRKNFRLADASHQKLKDSTSAIKLIFAIFREIDGFRQLIASKQLT
jgi:hypothetical protein